MVEEQSAARRAAWSGYWSGGALHSCVGSWRGNYGGAVAAFWHGVFAAWPSGGRVLDIGTGNGALPRLLLDVRDADTGLAIDAVDLADVAPAWVDGDEGARVRFHPRVAAEALPFPDAAFDAVVSQFGFEYADRERACAEIVRVLAPRGRIALVMHHIRSRLAHVARVEVGHVDRLLAPDGLLHVTAAVARWIAEARAGRNPSGVPEAARDRDAYNQAQRALDALIAATDVPDLLVDARDRAQRVLAGVGSDAGLAVAEVERWRVQLRDGRLRSAELVECALDDDAVAHLAAALRAARPESHVEVGVVEQAEGVLGWSLRMDPAG